jgi:hypothetical protein
VSKPTVPVDALSQLLDADLLVAPPASLVVDLYHRLVVDTDRVVQAEASNTFAEIPRSL